MKAFVPASNRGSSNMPKTPLWKATAGLAALGRDELADLLLEELARLRADVELLIARLKRLDDAAVSPARNRPAGRTRCPAAAGLRPSAWPARSARAECSTACPRGPDLRPRRGRSRCPSSSRVGLLQRHRQRAGGEDRADRAAGDHRFQVVELVDLEAAEDDQLRLQALLHRAVRTRRRRTCRAPRGPSPAARSCSTHRGCRPRGLR